MAYHEGELNNSGEHNQCHILAAHGGKVGCNTVECATAFLYSDFLWHGKKITFLYPLLLISMVQFKHLGF